MGTTESPPSLAGQQAEELLALSQSGQLARQFPALPPMLASLSQEQLLRAGQLLQRVGAEQVLAEHPGLPVVKVAITGHGTLSVLVPALTAETARHGIVLDAQMSPFDSWVADLSDPGGGLYATDPDLVLCVLDPMIILDELPVPWSIADLEEITLQKSRLIEQLAARFGEHGRGTLVLNTVPLLRRLTGQLIDYQSRAALGAVWRGFNARLLGLAENHRSLVVLDLDPLISEGTTARDPRMESYAKVNLSPGLQSCYAGEVGRLIRHLTGRTSKCLVVDLDETVWGGILGDDGIDTIEVGETTRGDIYAAFQRVVKQLGSQGVLLCALSKNEPDPVRKVFAEHPRMVLRWEDFVRVTANWRPKHENLRDLADMLNLGTASFVFADDSAYERGLIRHELPEVQVVDLDGEPAMHADRVIRGDWFVTRELTQEDRKRGTLYREEAARSDFLESFDSLDDYLRGLGIAVRISLAEESEMPRLAQLTLRTNQFNCTTKRMQVPEVKTYAADQDRMVVTVQASDRFGDHGIVGVIFARRDGAALHLDNFILSCRVFSREIEHACLTTLLRHAVATDAAAVTAHYRRSPKNAIVREFYPANGFETVTDDGNDAVFRHDLQAIADLPSHLNVTATLKR
jgi:FkbH-like protein